MATLPEQDNEAQRLKCDVVRAFGIDPDKVPWNGLDVMHEGGVTRVEFQTRFLDIEWTDEQREAVTALIAHLRGQS